MRSTVALLGLCLLAACSTASPAPTAVAGRDVRCLHHQVIDLGIGFGDATRMCGNAKPDLTGSRELQEIALVDRIPFTIRPRSDALLKQQASLVTGSLVPHEPSPSDPAAVAFPVMITPSGNR